jgi:tRNA modification GTPase
MFGISRRYSIHMKPLYGFLRALDSQITGDLLAMDIREVLHYLGEITGEITTDEILGNIFKNFCIGK